MLDMYRSWPQGSFNRPVPIPESAPGDSPLVCLSFNQAWVPYVLGCLKQLILPSTWGDASDPAVQAAQGAANDLIAIFAEAVACGVEDMAGSYAENCLETDVDIAAGALTDVMTLDVVPGDYELVLQASIDSSGGAAYVVLSVWDGESKLSEGHMTTPNPAWPEAMSLNMRVTPAVATTYTLKAATNSWPLIAMADPLIFSTAAHVTTCLRAYPLGITGPRGADGPPGPAYALRFNDSCGFEYSIDAGGTWLPVAGWADNAPTCFPGFDGAPIPIADIDPGSPPTMGDTVVSQRACNIAAYLANVVLQGALNEAQRQANLTKTALDFGVSLLALIPGIDLATLGFVEGANILYQLVDGDNLADFTSAATDETLWAAVVCAIYGCIADDGEVTAANFGCVTVALAGIPYAHTEVPTALSLFWAGLGVHAVRSAQIAGALESADCTTCGGFGPWCTWWESDQRDICNGDWTGITTGETLTAAVCAGSGFESVSNGAGGEFVNVQCIFPSARTITTSRVDYTGGHLDVFEQRFYDAADGLIFTNGGTNWNSGLGPGPIAGVKRITIIKGSGDSAFALTSIKVGGPDSGSPWGENNGVCD
jgi:hypothetical protein